MTGATWLDGNALAGLLAEVFGTEMTTAQHRCRSCQTLSALGAHRAYRGAGVVLRCPACGDLGLRIATLPDRYSVHFTGAWELAMPRREPWSSPRH
jgi:Family of unknown function (DUF6510)